MGIMHQVYMLQKAITQNGLSCVFYRSEENDFGEPTNQEDTITCKGLYHESSGYLNITLVEAGKVQTKKQPKLLVFYSEDIKEDNLVSVNGNNYKVIGVDDLGNMHLCFDLSLEVV